MLLSKFYVILLNAVFISVMLSPSAWGQDTDEDGVLSEVEDSTLDGSGAEAAAAANAVKAPEVPALSVDAKAPDAVPPAKNQGEVEKPSDTPKTETTSALPANQNAGETLKEQPNAEEEATSQETVEAEPTVPETPVADTKTEEPKEDVIAATDSVIKGTYGGRIFGRYKVQLAMNKPSFNDGQKCYEKFYGKPESHFSFGGDWFPLDWWINPGIMMRMGMYSVRGRAVEGTVSKSAAVDCDTLVVDKNSRTTLLFIPLQLGGKIQMSPFSRKWLVLDFWGAGEYGWWQETRDNSSAAAINLATSTDSSTRVYTNTGRKTAVSSGMSAHVLLNTIDERSVRSMVDTMGIGYVYLTGFMESVKSSSAKGLNFGRNVLGIGFTFETVK